MCYRSVGNIVVFIVAPSTVTATAKPLETCQRTTHIYHHSEIYQDKTELATKTTAANQNDTSQLIYDFGEIQSWEIRRVRIEEVAELLCQAQILDIYKVIKTSARIHPISDGKSLTAKYKSREYNKVIKKKIYNPTKLFNIETFINGEYVLINSDENLNTKKLFNNKYSQRILLPWIQLANFCVDLINLFSLHLFQKLIICLRSFDNLRATKTFISLENFYTKNITTFFTTRNSKIKTDFIKRNSHSIKSRLIKTKTDFEHLIYSKFLYDYLVVLILNRQLSRQRRKLCAFDRRFGDVAMILLPHPGMALFGMVWLLRVRSEMKRCAKCRRQAEQATPTQTDVASQSTFFTITDAAGGANVSSTPSPGHSLGPTTFCEVHGFMPPKDGEFNYFIY